MASHEIDGHTVEFEGNRPPTPEEIEDARQHLQGLAPTQQVTTTTTEPGEQGFVSRTISKITPTPRVGTGMMGGGIGAALSPPGLEPVGGALGFAGGEKAFDVGRNVVEYFRGEPQTGPRTAGQAVSAGAEDVSAGVGAEIGGMGLKALGTRLANTRLARFLVNKIRQTDIEEAGKAAQTEAGKAWVAGKETNGRLFDVIEKAAGDEGPHLTETGQVLQEVVETERRTPGGIPRAAARTIEPTLPEFERFKGKKRVGFERGAHIIRVIRKAAPDLDVDTAVALAQGLFQKNIPTKVIEDVAEHAPDVISVLLSKGKVPFFIARRAEEELSHMGGERRIPSPRQAIYRRLAGSMGRDIDQWLAADESGEGASALREAKTKWRDFRATHGLAQKALVGDVKLMRTGEPVAPERARLPEQAASAAFNPQTPTVTRSIQRVLPYETYRDLVGAWLHGLYEDAVEEVTPGTVRFSERKFARSVQAYVPRGHLDLILEPLVAHGDLPGGPESLLRAIRPSGVTRAGEKMRFGEHAPGLGAVAGFLGGATEPALTHLPGLMGGMGQPVNPLELTMPGIGALVGGTLTRPGGQVLQALGQRHPLERFAGPLLSEEAIRRAFAEFAAGQGQR